MDIIFCEKVDWPVELEGTPLAEAYISCIEITDIKSNAEKLLSTISDTSWISKLDPVGLATFEKVAERTREKLVQLFGAIENQVTKEFGEYMISMNSGDYLNGRHTHEILPLSELWKPRKSGNEGFDFHTLSASDKFSFGEAKYASKGNSYGESADQICRFIDEGKDKGDSGLLNYFNKPIAINNLLEGKRGFVVAFSLNSEDHKKILENSLQNENIKRLAGCCDELYIVGVRIRV